MRPRGDLGHAHNRRGSLSVSDSCSSAGESGGLEEFVNRLQDDGDEALCLNS